MDEDETHISTKFMELIRATDLNELHETKNNDLISYFLKLELKGSGWVLAKIFKLQITIALIIVHFRI